MVERVIREPTLQELEAGLQIDEHALDEACQQHPDLFYRVAKQVALLTSQRDDIKKRKEEIEAEVDCEIREDAENSKAKTTEKEIDSLKKLNKKVQDVTDKFLALNSSLLQMTALKESYMQRSYMLKSMVELSVTGYFGDPGTTSRAAHEERRQRLHEIRKNR